jgi:beta-phosphoglucomutase-like phosphatase (HAD superfamily)
VFKLNKFSAVIFDMDGLVLDTESTYLVAWQLAAKEMGYLLSESFCRSLSGLQYQDVELQLIAYCGVDLNIKLFNRLSDYFWREYVKINGIIIKPGFVQLMNFIVQQEIPYCLATNSSAINAYECLEFAGIKEVFSIIVSRDDVHYGKPAPDIFLKAAELLRVPIHKCVVLEDSHAGIEAASRAGAFSMLVPSSGFIDPLTIDLCDVIMTDLSQVLAYLE